jgi:hypothetical protein
VGLYGSVSNYVKSSELNISYGTYFKHKLIFAKSIYFINFEFMISYLSLSSCFTNYF